MTEYIKKYQQIRSPIAFEEFPDQFTALTRGYYQLHLSLGQENPMLSFDFSKYQADK